MRVMGRADSFLRCRGINTRSAFKKKKEQAGKEKHQQLIWQSNSHGRSANGRKNLDKEHEKRRGEW